MPIWERFYTSEQTEHIVHSVSSAYPKYLPLFSSASMLQNLKTTLSSSMMVAVFLFSLFREMVANEALMKIQIPFEWKVLKKKKEGKEKEKHPQPSQFLLILHPCLQMDSFDFYNINVKANAMQKHRQLQKMTNFLRVIEVCIVLVLISRLSLHLPHAMKNSSGYFHNLSVLLVSPRFVFVVGNVIIITLFAKSGQFSARDSTKNTSGLDIYEEITKNSEKNQKVNQVETRNLDKHIISDESVVKDYKKTQSEKISRGVCEKSHRGLRRMQTENFRKSDHSCQKLAKSSCPEDEMSNEEFQRKVEAFIARQQKIQREEEYSVF